MVNRDDTHTRHRLVDDIFVQLQERLASGMDGPAAFRTLLIDVTGYFDRAPRGAALETLQKFGVRSGMLFSNCFEAFVDVKIPGAGDDLLSSAARNPRVCAAQEVALRIAALAHLWSHVTLVSSLYVRVLQSPRFGYRKRRSTTNSKQTS